MADPIPPSNVISLGGALLRKRVRELVDAALEQWAPAVLVDAAEQMVELDIIVAQIIHGLKRAEISDFSEDVVNGRVSFTAKVLSAGDEFFVAASVERVVPFAGSHVVIRRVWR